MSGNIMVAGGITVIGDRFTIDIDSKNYDELSQEIISKAVENDLKIKINYALSTANGDNITSLTIEGSYVDRESFFSEIEKTYEIKTKIALLE